MLTLLGVLWYTYVKVQEEQKKLEELQKKNAGLAQPQPVPIVQVQKEEKKTLLP